MQLMIVFLSMRFFSVVVLALIFQRQIQLDELKSAPEVKRVRQILKGLIVALIAAQVAPIIFDLHVILTNNDWPSSSEVYKTSNALFATATTIGMLRLYGAGRDKGK